MFCQGCSNAAPIVAPEPEDEVFSWDIVYRVVTEESARSYVVYDTRLMAVSREFVNEGGGTTGPPPLSVERCDYAEVCLYESDDGLPIIVDTDIEGATARARQNGLTVRVEDAGEGCSNWSVSRRENRQKNYIYCAGRGVVAIEYMGGMQVKLELESGYGLGLH